MPSYLGPSILHNPNSKAQLKLLQNFCIIFFRDNSTKETTDKPEENEEEELAAAISQSAEEGIAWFNNFISSVFGEETNETSSAGSVNLSQNKTQVVNLTR